MTTTLHYCGYVDIDMHRKEIHKENTEYTDSSIRQCQGVLNPLVLTELQEDFASKIICLCCDVFVLTHDKRLTRYNLIQQQQQQISLQSQQKLENYEQQQQFHKQHQESLRKRIDLNLIPLSIHADQSADRLLVMCRNESTMCFELYALSLAPSIDNKSEVELTEKRKTRECYEPKHVEKELILILDSDIKSVKEIGCGYSMGVLTTSEGKVYRINKCMNKWSIVHLPMPHQLDQVSFGKEHVIALFDGQVFTMGSSSRGQLGLGYTTSHDSFVKVEMLEPLRFKMVAAGGWHSLALSENGDLYAWGWNESGQAGVTSLETESVSEGEEPTKETIPKLIFLPNLIDAPLDLTFRYISAGTRHSIAVSEDGDVYTWGWNGYGQLGHGDQLDRFKPSLVKHYQDQNYGVVYDIYIGPWSTIVKCKST